MEEKERGRERQVERKGRKIERVIKLGKKNVVKKRRRKDGEIGVLRWEKRNEGEGEKGVQKRGIKDGKRGVLKL